METPEEFANRWTRGKPWREKLLENLAMALVISGSAGAFFDELNQFSVPLLLTGIAIILWKVAIYAEGILVGLEWLTLIVKKGKK